MEPALNPKLRFRSFKNRNSMKISRIHREQACKGFEQGFRLESFPEDSSAAGSKLSPTQAHKKCNEAPVIRPSAS